MSGEPRGRARIRELDEAECRAVLERNRVARLAFSFRDRVGITPVHYVLSGNWLYGRTSPGEKLEAIRRNWWVAVAVDEIEGPFDWRSVVVRGGFYILDPDSPDTRELYEQAVTEVRRMAPAAFSPDDPAPERTILFGVALQEVTGRESRYER